MKEIDLQTLIVNAVRASGGAAHKLSNRFLVGVVDLLVKLPHHEGALFEVKLARFSRVIASTHRFKLEVTEPQKMFLRNYARAGMPTGVISGLLSGTSLSLQCLGLDAVERAAYTALVGEHVFVGQGDARFEGINTLLRGFFDG